MKLDPNAPAFPVPGIPPVSTGDPRDGMGYGTDPQPGITIRAYIATQAMQSYIGYLGATGQTVSKCHAEIADESCRIADALIARLNDTQAAETTVVIWEDTGLDARRYRRLRVLGCAVNGHPNLDKGTVSCFTNLDKIVDEDLAAHKSRGEFEDPAPVSRPALPPGIPEPPEGVVYYGMGPLKVPAKNNDRFDVFSFDPRLQGDLWESYNTGECEPPYLHYAIRRGTPIARANGIPD